MGRPWDSGGRPQLSGVTSVPLPTPLPQTAPRAAKATRKVTFRHSPKATPQCRAWAALQHSPRLPATLPLSSPRMASFFITTGISRNRPRAKTCIVGEGSICECPTCQGGRDWGLGRCCPRRSHSCGSHHISRDMGQLPVTGALREGCWGLEPLGAGAWSWLVAFPLLQVAASPQGHCAVLFLWGEAQVTSDISWRKKGWRGWQLLCDLIAVRPLASLADHSSPHIPADKTWANLPRVRGFQ